MKLLSLILLGYFLFVSFTSGFYISVESKSVILKNQLPMGIVNPIQRCGGYGNMIQLRISDCEGICKFSPGIKYDCELDILPVNYNLHIKLRLELCYLNGLCVLVFDDIIARDSWNPGGVYTVKYSFTPTEFFSGQQLKFKGIVYHVDNGLEESCVMADIQIM